jgi:hypothetical protein
VSGVAGVGDVDAGLALLERRRRQALWGALAALVIGLLCWPIGVVIGVVLGEGSETLEVIGGSFMIAAIAGVIAAPVIVRLWQRFMERHLLEEAVRGRAEIRHIDGDRRATVSKALASNAFDLAAFRASGLSEPFASARVDHVLIGRSQDVPFALASLRLLDAKGYRVFAGVLASFRLARPRPGLTIVTRDRGLLGNLLARAGSGVERVALEDPTFEGVFEAYGTDQVQARLILTTTMLERLKELDEVAHARGFTCAFRDGHLLIAFRGMRWRCAPWRVLQPVRAWVPAYRRWVGELIDLPARIAATLDLRAPEKVVLAPAPAAAGRVALVDSDAEVFSGGLSRLVGEVGMALGIIASGAIFGGTAAVFAGIGLEHGLEAIGGWPIGLLIALGLAYGVHAITYGLWSLIRLARTWGAPLRGVPATRATARPSDRVGTGLS